MSTPARLDIQFETLEQQHETRTLGMWLFLLTEVMLFGAMLTMYTVYRSMYPDAFAEGSRRLDLALGGINTGILILSSVCLALAVYQAQTHDNRLLITGFLAATAVLGLVFLGLKGYEYYLHFLRGEVPALNFQETGAQAAQLQLFFWMYFALTGVHAVHMLVGIGLVLVIALRVLLGHFSPQNYAPVEMTGLYWHFVDIVWIFLFPLLYLIAR